jgi:hypothetical protein
MTELARVLDTVDREVDHATARSVLGSLPREVASRVRQGQGPWMSRPGRTRRLLGADGLEVLVDEDVVRPAVVDAVDLFHPPISQVRSTWMALASCPARQGQQRSLRKMRRDLSWALARSPGARSRALARLASFCEAGLFRPRHGVRMQSSPMYPLSPVSEDERTGSGVQCP